MGSHPVFACRVDCPIRGSIDVEVEPLVLEVKDRHGERLVGEQVWSPHLGERPQLFEVGSEGGAVHQHAGVDYQHCGDDHGNRGVVPDELDRCQLGGAGEDQGRQPDLLERGDAGVDRREPGDKRERNDPDQDGSHRP